MRPVGHARAAPEDACLDLIAEGRFLTPSDTLESALPRLDRTDAGFLPVVIPATEERPPRLLGAVFHIDALKAYNRALAAVAAEEHS